MWTHTQELVPVPASPSSAEPDYPAAHSMDSSWFAVDADGHVGYFRTGEAGAMPYEGVTGDAAELLIDRLARAVPPTEAIHDPRGHLLPGHDRGFDHMVRLSAQEYPLLLFVTSLAPLQTDIEAKRATPVRAAEGYAVILPRLTAEQARRLNEAGVVVTSAYYFDDADGERDRPARFGVYEYGHLCENWISGPYGRERVPARPLHVDQLPPELRQRLRAVTLDLCFGEMPHIQPVEHLECHSWEEEWQGVDGAKHPFGEREGS
jgi:hypothetical protein